MPESAFPKPFPYPNEVIEDWATKFRSVAMERLAIKTPPSGCSDVRAFMERAVRLMQGEVEVSSTPSWLESEGGSLTIAPNAEGFVIRLSPLTSPIRDNFTIAHELGHYLLHYPHQAPLSREVSFNRYGSSLLEQQANAFAASFLMPRKEFAAIRQSLGGNEYLIGSHFGVSPPAVQIRMRNVPS
jgi:hypothetical protein